MTKQARGINTNRWVIYLLIWIGLSLAAGEALAAAKPKLILSKVSWSANQQTLVVKGKLAHGAAGATVELYDVNGRRLGTPDLNGKGSFGLTLTESDLPSIPCAVRAQAGTVEKLKKVVGAPKLCARTPNCQITAPSSGFSTQVNTPVQFTASVKLPKAVKNPKYEWDFGGGAMGEELTDTGLAKTYKRPESTQANVAFVHNNSRYRVHFVVTDGDANHSVGSPQYRCEDSVEIAVGTPPEVPPGVAPMVAASVASAPKKAGEANGTAGDLVVLPFQDWTMQHAQDNKLVPNASVSFAPPVNTLNSHVIKKGSTGATEGPQFLTSDIVDLRYSAAGNPSDPVGAGSINSTSQNWPLNADTTQFVPLMDSTTAIQKTDFWEKHPPRPSSERPWSQWQSYSAAEQFFQAQANTDLGGRPDESYWPTHITPEWTGWDIGAINGGEPWGDELNKQVAADWYAGRTDALTALTSVMLAPVEDHGTYMPGINNPFVANDPQAFRWFDKDQQWFSARWIPITDVDDLGRANVSPLLRVEAVNKDGSAVSASTDAVLSNGKDFHCRGCHAKDQIAANPNAGYTADAFHSSPSGLNAGNILGQPYSGPHLAKPEFVGVADMGGNPDSIFDQEYAAMLNYTKLHQFYDGMEYILMDHITLGDVGLRSMTTAADGSITSYELITYVDQPQSCTHCHVSALFNAVPGGTVAYNDTEFGLPGADGSSYSNSMHRFHGELQYNTDKTDIVRNDRGSYLRFDSSGKPRVANTDINPNTLFPIFGPDGKQLPMEQNCLKCHAGHREQLYRDRMYTSGVTCFDCHGDMLSVGGTFPKDNAKTGSRLLADYRKPWVDETDCGSCHVGNANIGKNDTVQFFSAGVKKRAFDDTDPSATTFLVDKADPDAVRFSVVPDYESEYMDASKASLSKTTPVKVDLPLYRYGKDAHGKVACAACHGAAHAVAPNRDPSSNDNVTALQLQGYPGHIMECKVCHTTDAFKDLANLDGSVASGLPEGVLGGPHNMHPVNDPNWYLQRSSGDERNNDGTQYGGWHNVVAGKPGVKNEDQCAACHGDDHLGTRLSRTPVDRVFDFRKLDFKKLKKLGFKKKVVKVAAGTTIGCNTCHSVETSRLKTPAGPVATRHSPVISATPEPTATIGINFSGYQVNASDTDGGTLSYSLAKAPDGMSIDSASGMISWSHTPANPDDVFDFKVEVTDASGLSASQWFIVKPTCPSSATNWDAGIGQAGLCTPLKVTSTPPVTGVDASQAFDYTATTSSPATFTIIDSTSGQAPTFTPAISIDPSSGAIHWTPDTTTAATVSFRIIATDGQGHQASQDVSLTVCQLPQHWDAGMGMCM